MTDRDKLKLAFRAMRKAGFDAKLNADLSNSQSDRPRIYVFSTELRRAFSDPAIPSMLSQPLALSWGPIGSGAAIEALVYLRAEGLEASWGGQDWHCVIVEPTLKKAQIAEDGRFSR